MLYRQSFQHADSSKIKRAFAFFFKSLFLPFASIPLLIDSIYGLINFNCCTDSYAVLYLQCKTKQEVKQ